MSTDDMSSQSELEQLASRFGITTSFENALGQVVTVPPQTILLLLNSMGVDIADEAEARGHLEQFDRAAAERALPATVVLVPKNGICELVLSKPELPGSIDWQVTLEDGGELSGQAEPVLGGASPLRLPNLPYGYHRLRLPQLDAETNLIVSPGQCWLPDKGEHGHWGIAVQLYLLRSATNWGIGDFSDLRTFVELAAARDCAVIGLNPLHQMFLDDPEAASPYSPATRLFLNPLYIDVTAIPEFARSEPARALVNSAAFQQRLERCRAAKLVDYTEVAALKLEALRLIHETFTSSAVPERKQAWATFRNEEGQDLDRAALFQAVRQHFAKQGPEQADWRQWPAEMQSAGSDAEAEFAREHASEVDFQAWLQFIADEQLALAADMAERQGMAIGLYRDLAVGCDQSGAETWANPPAFLQRTLVGAPPDIYNPAGQNWGLPPFDPAALKEEGYRSFARLIRANMRHAGGLRIDHVMGLRRLYCIPEGKSAAEGAYVNFPLDDLIGVLALESQRHQCLVVGEDLGTVPPGFRERLAAANILSYRVLFFEQDFNTARFLPPQSYPELALAVTGSHDLATLKAWWTSGDLSLKDTLGLYSGPEETKDQMERRERERRNILVAFAEAGLVDEIPEVSALSSELFADMAHQFLARTASLLIATQLDDITGEVEPVNVPGTSTENPNWRRKYGLSVEDLAHNQQVWELVKPFSRGGDQGAGPS